jgi:environmental stress-induced protein Ves
MIGKHLAKKDFIEMPWKNGQGVTTELYRLDRDGRMVFRLSSAAVTESGLFSDYSGYDRTLVNLGPGTMMLAHNEKPSFALSLNAVTHFDGGSNTFCQIDQPLRDLNVFCAHGEVFATTVVRGLKALEVLPVPPTSSVFIYAISGALTIDVGGGESLLVNAGEAFLREADATSTQARLSFLPSGQMNAVFAAVLFHNIAK